MQKLTNHTKIVQLRETTTNTYAWDFIFSEGDTIKEKSASLLDMITTCCLRKNEDKEPSHVVASNGFLISILATQPGFEFSAEMDDFPVGQYSKDCGNGYHTDFLLYKYPEFSKEEVLIISKEVSVIKIFNALE